MSRLTHSDTGFQRAMQMSATSIFVLVEGRTDAYFYDSLCNHTLSSFKVIYQIVRADELPGGTGGKQALLAFFKYLRSRSSLVNNFRGKVTCVIFYLDKDVDDFRRRMCKSSHLVYTAYYHIDNHIFEAGNLLKAVAVAASLEYGRVTAWISSNDTWRRQVAEYWKEWVKLCLFATTRRIGCECTYKSLSRIQTTYYGPVNPTEYQKYCKILETRSNLSPVQFARAFQRIGQRVEGLYNDNKHDVVFKGKWYAHVLASHIKALAGTLPFDNEALPHTLQKTIIQTLDFDEAWSDYFKKPLLNLLSYLDLP